MRKLVMKATAIAAMVIAASAHSVEFDPTDPKNKLDAIVELPIKSLRAVEADGEIMFVSENGRFVLKGQLFDVWYKDTIDTIPQMVDVTTRIRFDRMGANIDEYNTLTIGHGAKQVVVFVDPLCAICHKLMKDAEKLGRDYTFKFVVVPALGDKSNELSRRVFCAENRADALPAFMSNTLETLPQQASCDTGRYDLTLMFAHLLDIQAVPFVVAPDGRFNYGRPAELKKWLEDRL
jgi:thiol:disulfide interchange protein DsbC